MISYLFAFIITQTLFRAGLPFQERQPEDVILLLSEMEEILRWPTMLKIEIFQICLKINKNCQKFRKEVG